MDEVVEAVRVAQCRWAAHSLWIVPSSRQNERLNPGDASPITQRNCGESAALAGSGAKRLIMNGADFIGGATWRNNTARLYRISSLC